MTLTLRTDNNEFGFLFEFKFNFKFNFHLSNVLLSVSMLAQLILFCNLSFVWWNRKQTIYKG